MTKSRNNVIILQAIKNYTILKWGLGRSPKRGEGGSPTFSPGTDAGRVCTRALHDAKPTKHTQPFTGERGLWFRQGCRDRTPKGFMQGRIQVVEQSRCRTHRQQTTTIAEMQSQPSIHSFSRGKGGFGKDAEIRTHRALSMDAYKWSNKVGAGRTDNKRPRLQRRKAHKAFL